MSPRPPLTMILLAGGLAASATGQQLLHAIPGGTGALAAADVNGDGRPDVLIGDSSFNPVAGTGSASAGRIRAFSGLDASLLYELDGQTSCNPFFGCSGTSLGIQVSGAGDVNHDGLQDFFDQEANGVRLRSGLGGLDLHLWLQAPDVQAAGDVDDDGFVDVIVGIPISETFGNPGGVASVRSGVDDSVLLTLHPTGTGAPGGYGLGSFGRHVAGGVDFDADGHPDLLVAAPNDHNTAGGEFLGAVGSVWAFSGADGSLLFHVNGFDVHQGLGWSIATLPDVNGDGHDDFAAGAGVNGPGYVRVYSGADGSVLFTLGPSASWHLPKVAHAGDFNGDGTADVLVGTPNDATFGQFAGAARVFSGSDGGLLHVFGGSGTDVGGAIAGLGDLDGDGRDELAFKSGPDALIYGGITKPWTDLGGGLAGGGGQPVIVGDGSLAPSTLVSIAVSDGPALGLGFLFLGLSEANLSFKGGTLVPSPDFVFPFLLDSAGNAMLAQVMPADGPSPPPFYVQAWLVDASAPHGASATDALLATPP